MSNWFDSLSSDVGKTALAGALGGIVRWMTLREDWKSGVISLVVGSICALYLGPLAAPLMEPWLKEIAPKGDSLGFSSFVVGLGGISISGWVLDLIKQRTKRSGK